MSRSSQGIEEDYEKKFRHDFSSFVATELDVAPGPSWDKILIENEKSWEFFFELVEQFFVD